MLTKFGRCDITENGYYRINGGGFHNKLLHRLIYEDYYHITLLEWTVIHHKDVNKLNNDISNLEMMIRSEHISLHTKGRRLSDEHRRKVKENHADVNGNKNPKWGTSVLEEWGGMWFLEKMACSGISLAKLSRYIGYNETAMREYLYRRNTNWTTLITNAKENGTYLK